jgi:hypothetical protein
MDRLSTDYIIHSMHGVHEVCVGSMECMFSNWCSGFCSYNCGRIYIYIYSSIYIYIHLEREREQHTYNYNSNCNLSYIAVSMTITITISRIRTRTRARVGVVTITITRCCNPLSDYRLHSITVHINVFYPSKPVNTHVCMYACMHACMHVLAAGWAASL